jgi:hypothetical protein
MRLPPAPPPAATRSARGLLPCAVGLTLLSACAGTEERPDDTPMPTVPVGAAESSALPAAAPQDPSAPVDDATTGVVDPPPSTDELQPLYRGSIATTATLRKAGSDEDIDVYAYVEADIGDPDGGLAGTTRRERWSARFAGRVHADVDGDRGDLFDGLDDTYDNALVGRVYDAWADWSPEDGALEHVRFGRQSDWETPVYIVFDGLRAQSAPLGDAEITLGAYGGSSTHQYESSNEGDWLYGLWANAAPWKGGVVRLDWLHAEDERTVGSFEEDVLGLSVQQRISREWRASAAWTALGSEARDLDLDASWSSTDGRQHVRGTYYQLFETQSANPLEFDTFSETLFDWFPFRRAGLLGWTRIGEKFRLEGGYDNREVEDDSDEGRYNRDVDRLHVTGAWDGALGEGSSIAVTGDQWLSDARDVRSIGASFSQELGQRSDVSLGTYYAAYETDMLLGTEREDVRTYFVTYGREYSKTLDLDASYSFQDTDFEEFHTLRMTLRWQF